MQGKKKKKKAGLPVRPVYTNHDVPFSHVRSDPAQTSSANYVKTGAVGPETHRCLEFRISETLSLILILHLQYRVQSLNTHPLNLLPAC